jgi:ferrous iron transport protein A
VRLSELPKGTAAWVVGVEAAHAADKIARRLRDLGFVRGEAVRILATGPFGGDPLLVRIADSRFALRRTEAARVTVTLDALASAPSPATGAAHAAPLEGVVS